MAKPSEDGLREVLGAAVIGGLLTGAAYALWLWAQDEAAQTPLADFPYLAGLGLIFALLGIADWILALVSSRIRRTKVSPGV